MTNTFLNGADLSAANLTDALMQNTHLNGTNFNTSCLRNTCFEPVSLPVIHLIANAQHLKDIKYFMNPTMVVMLREEFSKAGFKRQEREIICALRRHDPHFLETVLFDWTSEFGSNLQRPWYILIGIWFLCGVAHYGSMFHKSDSGIYLISEEDHILDPSKIVYYNPIIKNYAPNWIQKIPMWIRLWWWALFFSTMSAFNIGFRDINFARWLRHTTRKEFDLKPTGWVRVVSGFQAITSVYLIGLWALSFAGTPFK